MSASLVGSEMCIRDRGCIGFKRPVGQPPGQRRSGTVMFWRAGGAWWCTHVARLAGAVQWEGV
eukprot:13005604-Alexandrium_andersonii.AAC.1